MNLNMEKRKCARPECNQTFTVLETSSQRFHSTRCESETTGVGLTWQGRLKPSNEEDKQTENVTRKSVKIPSSSKKQEIVSAKPITPTLKKPVPKAAPTTTNTQIATTKPEPKEEREHSMKRSNTKENTTLETGKDFAERSALLNIDETRPEDSIEQKAIIETEGSHSMNLLDSTAKQLHDLMGGLVKSKNNLDPTVVDSACNCAKNIREIAKLKLDFMKYQTGGSAKTKKARRVKSINQEDSDEE